MSLWQKLLALRKALDAGEKLQDAATWKTRSTLVNVVVALLTALYPFLDELTGIDPAQLHDLALDIGGGVYGFVVLYNAYMHLATSDTVGIRS